MTVSEFKKERPEYAHLEGDELWDAMTIVKLREQQGEVVLKQLKAFWKRYKLRYLFYVRKKSAVFVTHESAKERCAKCKRGAGTAIAMMGKMFCLCGSELVTEPNTNFSHYKYKVKKWIVDNFFKILEAVHIVRYSHEGRYDMAGDESEFVVRHKYNLDWQYIGRDLRPRKWWEYIFIER